jgi:hypothetical protein
MIGENWVELGLRPAESWLKSWQELDDPGKGPDSQINHERSQPQAASNGAIVQKTIKLARRNLASFGEWEVAENTMKGWAWIFPKNRQENSRLRTNRGSAEKTMEG